MYDIDSAILSGTLTCAMLETALASPLPPEGHSYWGDVMRQAGGRTLKDAKRAVLVAASQMGAALASLASVCRT